MTDAMTMFPFKTKRQDDVPAMETASSMESNENVSRTYPFAAAETDIDMIDRPQAVPASPAIASNGASAANPVEMARQVAGVVQDLVRRLDEQAVQRQQLEQRLASYQESARAYESLKQALRGVVATPVTEDDLETLEKVLQAMAQDPNHIMVLASVAQQSAKLQSVVTSFHRLRDALQQVPPH